MKNDLTKPTPRCLRTLDLLKAGGSMTGRPVFTTDELAACAEREVKFRKRVYARRIQLGKMEQDLADREIALMEAIRDHFRAEAVRDDVFGRCG